MSIRKSAKDLIEALKPEGILFSKMTMIHDGDYTTYDADWNYKDVPHLHCLHQLVEAYPSLVSDEMIATINMQKILGLAFPLPVFNYHTGKNNQTYYSTLFGFILIVETQWESIGEIRTRVTTTYNIGSNRLLRWAHPLIRFLIKRNAKDLLSEDIPMRNRRGTLRKWGYQFKSDTIPYSFLRTMAIHERNVVNPPIAPPQPLTIDVAKDLPHEGTSILLGESNHFGLKLVRNSKSIAAFPRLCNHEGSCLDNANVKDKHLTCPWHGKSIAPLFSFSLDQSQLESADSEFIAASLSGNELHIEFKGTKIGELKAS